MPLATTFASPMLTLAFRRCKLRRFCPLGNCSMCPSVRIVALMLSGERNIIQLSGKHFRKFKSHRWWCWRAPWAPGAGHRTWRPPWSVRRPSAGAAPRPAWSRTRFRWNWPPHCWPAACWCRRSPCSWSGVRPECRRWHTGRCPACRSTDRLSPCCIPVLPGTAAWVRMSVWDPECTRSDPSNWDYRVSRQSSRTARWSVL